MPNLTNTLVDAAGVPKAGSLVTIELIGAWTADGVKETQPAAVWSGTTDASGVWTAPLPAQSAYEGATYYRVREPNVAWSCTVADTPSTQKLRDRLTVPIPPAPLTAATLDGSGKVPISQLPTGTTSSTVTIGNDARLSDSRTPSGAAGGSLSGTYPNPGIAAGAVGGTEVAVAIKDPAAGTAGLRTLGTGAAQAAAGNDARLSDSRTPTGTAGGDLAGTYPNPTIKTALNDPAAATPGLRTLGTGAQQAAAGNDSRITGAVQTSRLITTGTGLSGGGDLSADRTHSVLYGTASGTATQGNDSRVVNAVNRTGDALTGPLSTSGNAFGKFGAADHNFVSWAFDPALAVNNLAPIGGTVYLVKLLIPAAVTIGNIYWHVGSAAVTPTAGQNEVGLYSSAGTKLASANVDSATTSTGLKTTAITGQALSAGSFVWVGLVFNAATLPALAKGTSITGAGSLNNAGLSAANYRFANNGAGQTALPANITPGSNAQTSFNWWVAAGT